MALSSLKSFCTLFRTQPDESFEAFVEAVAPGKLDKAREEVGDSKVRKGIWLGENVQCPSKVRKLYYDIVKVLRKRGLS